MAEINPLQKAGALGGILTAGAGWLENRRWRQERKQAALTSIDISEWGDVRPTVEVINQAIESSQGRLPTIRGRKPPGQRFDQDAERGPDTYRNPVTQEFYEEAQRFQDDPSGGFDHAIFNKMVEWARVHDEPLFWNLVGGKGNTVLYGYDPETGEARGQHPDTLTRENLARHVEEGTTPYLPEFLTGNDIATIVTQYDFPLARQNWEKEIDQAEFFQSSTEALLGRDGALHGDITSAYDSSSASVRDITALTQGGIDRARSENELGRERTETRFQAGLDRSEARRTRGLSEFEDDTAQRIESSRIGLTSRLKSDMNKMMSEMQASGASQREITAAVREQTFAARTELTQLSMGHNIEVAKLRSDLSFNYDGLTASYDELGFSEMTALERQNVVAESGFSVLTAQAAEAVAIHTSMVEFNTVTMRSQADMAYLNNQVVLGDMLNRLSESMPQMGEFGAVAFEAIRKEDAIDQGYFTTGLAFASEGWDKLTAIGDKKMDAEIAAEAQEAAEPSGLSQGLGFANLGVATITGGLTGGLAAAGPVVA